MRKTLATIVLTALLAAPAAADNWKHVTKEQGLPGDEIQFIEQDPTGTVWIGTLSGLATWDNGKIGVRLEKGRYWDVLKSGDKYWVGSSGGVLLFNGEEPEHYLKGNTVAPLVQFDNDTVYAISKNLGTEQNSLARSTEDGWEVVEPLKGKRVSDMWQTRDGTVWVSIEGNGVYAIKPGEGPAKAVHHLQGRSVTTMFEDSSKRLWAGTWGQGVYSLDGDDWTRHLPKEKSAIFAIREGAKGVIWVATSANGLWRHEDGKWINDLADEGGINLLERTNDGRVWISSQMVGGLRYWDGKKWVVSLDSPLPIRCLIETKKGKILAGGVLDGLYIKQ